MVAWNTVTDVNDGQSFGGAAWQTAIDAIDQLQDVIGPDAPTASTVFTPAFTGVTLGAGTAAGRMTRFGPITFVLAHFVFGSGTSITGNLGLTLPFTVFSIPGGSVFILDADARNYIGGIKPNGGDSVLFAHTESGGAGIVTSAAPMTWVAGDSLTAWMLVLTA